MVLATEIESSLFVTRWLKVELRQLTSVCPKLDRGNVCPGCPKV